MLVRRVDMMAPLLVRGDVSAHPRVGSACLSLSVRSPPPHVPLHARARVPLPAQGELNPSVFLAQHRQMSLDAGQAMLEAVDTRLSLAATTRRPGAHHSPADVARVNSDADRALSLFVHFVRCYKDDRCSSALSVLRGCRPAIPCEPLNGATALDDESR